MTDFRKIIIDLNAAGLSDREIARRTGVTQPAISRMRNKRGVDPRYSLGHALCELHTEIVERRDAA